MSETRWVKIVKGPRATREGSILSRRTRGACANTPSRYFRRGQKRTGRISTAPFKGFLERIVPATRGAVAMVIQTIQFVERKRENCWGLSRVDTKNLKVAGQRGEVALQQDQSDNSNDQLLVRAAISARQRIRLNGKCRSEKNRHKGIET